MLVIGRRDLQALVSMPQAIELMKTAFAELSAGRTASPLRTLVHLDSPPVDALFMPGSVPSMAALGLKVVAVAAENASRGLPLIHATVFLVDPTTGQPLALVDGTYLTALRTGAVSGAATSLLARPDSKTLVVFGAGAQGVTQAAAVAAVRPIERVVVVDVKSEAIERYKEAVARDWPELSDRVEGSDDRRVVREADVICTASTAREAVFDDRDVRPGTHINAIGAYTPEMQEVPAETVLRSVVVVDEVEAALAEAGDLIKPINAGLLSKDDLTRELGALVSGAVTGRTSEDQVTFFKSVGNAVQDVSVARFAFDEAKRLGRGTKIDLS